MSIARKWGPLSALFGALALLAAGGLLIGLGSDTEKPDGSSPGAAAAEATTGVPTAPDATAGREVGVRSTNPVEPTRLKIPSLDIDAPVLPIEADGLALVPPSDPQTVGWWSTGARPGAELGTAILTGHTVSSGGGVFDDLEQMRPGQRIQILSRGSRLRLQVNSVRTYEKAALAKHARDIFNQSSPGRVALVTCEDWNGTVYLKNVVVLAKPIG